MESSIPMNGMTLQTGSEEPREAWPGSEADKGNVNVSKAKTIDLRFISFPDFCGY